MGDTSIEWTQRPGTKGVTWNPIVAYTMSEGQRLRRGWHCEHVTTGCINCYSERQNIAGARGGTMLPYKPGHRDDISVELHEPTLLAPLRWRAPRTVFVCSMTDLFGEFHSDEMIDRVFAVMALSPQHTFQVLTKRAARMRDYFAARKDNFGRCSESLMGINAPWLSEARIESAGDVLDVADLPDGRAQHNVWLGISAERQQEADERIPLLLQTPAAVRFVSLEPLLGAIDLGAIEAPDKVEGERWTFNALTNGDYYEQWSETVFGEPRRSGGDGPYREHALDWVIVGGESGPKARPMQPEWARDLWGQCFTAGVPFFFKQWGEWAPRWPGDRSDGMQRVGKKRAGRLLDGCDHNEFPDTSQRERGAP